ncbi:MAG: T9SS type A sorting domain-containing protein [Candidatus Delongbacteria bacterium]
MRKVLFFLFVLLSAAAFCQANAERLVYIYTLDMTGTTYDFSAEPYGYVTFKAWISDRPTEVITQNSEGCGYEMLADFYSSIRIQLASFPTEWQAGDEICVLVREQQIDFCVEGYLSFQIEYNEFNEVIYIGFEDVIPGTGLPLLLQYPCVGIDENGFTPASAALEQNFPNPFNPVTEISFSIPETSVVDLSVYDTAGKLVRTLVNEKRTYGHHAISFDASDLNSGIYFYRLQTDGRTIDAKRMLLIK